MSTYDPYSLTPGVNRFWPCSPDQFAPFKRGDKVVCLTDIPPSDWLHSPPPRKDQVYTVRDYHFGNAETNKPGQSVYGQIINLEGVICDRTPWRPDCEWGWFHTHFRKVEEQVDSAAVSETNVVEAGA
jgi:hypothetical protein